MERIHEALGKRGDYRFFLIFGPGTQDLHLDDNATPVDFLVALNSDLLKSGFDRVIHVSPTTIVRCIDETSRTNCSQYIWPQREEVLLTGMIDGIATGPFGHKPRRSSQELQKPQNIGLGDIHGIRIVDAVMKDPGPLRTAVVCFDALTFLDHFESQRILFGILNEWLLLPGENLNQCFFVVPVTDKKILTKLLEPHKLLQYLHNPDQDTFDQCVLQISYPIEEELTRLFKIYNSEAMISEVGLRSIIRIALTEDLPLRTWIHRLEVEGMVDIPTMRKLRWIQSNNGDIRSVDEKINDYVGLDEVKSFIQLIRDLSLYHNQNPEKPLDRSFHMIFYGNPGTGKTSVARLFGQIFQESGFLQKGHLVEVKGSDLVSEFVGGTGVKTNDVIDRARDGILFVDEAYSLSESDRGGFGKEAVEVLLKRMEDERDHLVVILAGYKEKMQSFLKINPGLARRFPQSSRIEFQDFSPSELFQILKRQLTDHHLLYNDQITSILEKIVSDLCRRKTANFGNGGEMRNLAESIDIRVKARLANYPDSEDGITIRDIPDSYLPIDRSTQSTIEQILDPLDGMVGLNHVKEHLLALAKIKKLDAMKNENSYTIRTKYLEHYLFLGNPGTGKTTTARLMSEMLFRMGVLKTRNIVEVSAVDMIAGYVGQTPEKARQVIEKAMDGVLFIDEAYTLLPGGRDGMTGYGREVIDTMVKSIDEYKDRLVIIMAGYPSEMLELIQSNPGLTSRFSKMIYFPDFNDVQLSQILCQLCARDGYEISEDVLTRANQQLLQVKSISPRTFGNAREVERLYRHMIQNLANRIIADPSNIHHIDELPPHWNEFEASDVDGYEILIDKTLSWEDPDSVRVTDREPSKRKL